MKTSNIKNLFAICLIAMFVISLMPLAFADNASTSTNTSITSSGQTGRGHGMRQDIIAARETNKENREKIKEMRTEIKEERKDFMEHIKATREDVLESLKAAREAKKSGNINETISKYKEFLLKTDNQRLEELNEAKTKIDESKELSDQEKSDIMTLIDAQISRLTTIKAQIEAATTKELIKDGAKSLREAKADSFRRFFSLRILSARIQGLVNRAKILGQRLDIIVDKAKSRNIDISSEVSSFKAKIAVASDKQSQAHDKLAQTILLMKGSGDKDQIKSSMDETRQLLKDAAQALKDAHEMLKSIVNKIKSAAPGSKILETEYT